MYTASEGGVLAGTEQGAKMLANFMAPEKLTLKVGAQVSSLALFFYLSWSW